jgi:hypothetical protein
MEGTGARSPLKWRPLAFSEAGRQRVEKARSERNNRAGVANSRYQVDATRRRTCFDFCAPEKPMIYEILTNGQFVFWSAITIIVVAPALGHYWASVRRAEIEAGLKRDMIARGMSADEIERVLNAEKNK